MTHPVEPRPWLGSQESMEKPHPETLHCFLLSLILCGNGAPASHWWLRLGSSGLPQDKASSQTCHYFLATVQMGRRDVRMLCFYDGSLFGNCIKIAVLVKVARCEFEVWKCTTVMFWNLERFPMIILWRVLNVFWSKIFQWKHRITCLLANKVYNLIVSQPSSAGNAGWKVDPRNGSQ